MLQRLCLALAMCRWDEGQCLRGLQSDEYTLRVYLAPGNLRGRWCTRCRWVPTREVTG